MSFTIEIGGASWTHLSNKYGDIPEPGSNTPQTSSLIIDVNLDGLNDFVITRRGTSPNIIWYLRNTTGWNKYVIENNIPHIEAGGSFQDIDGDGDPDIVFGGDWLSNKVWWWENPYPVYDPDISWTRREIKSFGAYKHHDEIFGDFDGDGESELVFWNQDANKLFLADIPLDPKTTQPWLYTEIWSSGTHAEGLGKGDIDNDGKIDIIGGGRWFKHTGGTNYTAILIDDSQRNSRVAFGDLKKGGNPEIVMVPGDAFGRLKWYECTGDPAYPGCWVGHDLLGFDVDNGHSLAIADMNNDGNLDIFAAEMRLDSGNPDAKSWIFYGNGNGSFQTELVSEGIGNHESKVGDLNGDGRLDILGKPFNWDIPRIDIWLQNRPTLSLDNWTYHQVDATRQKYYDSWYSYFGLSVYNATMGNCKNIVSGKYVYKNSGCNLNSSWSRSELPVDSDGALFVNLDNNSNQDIIAFGLPYVYWFEATDTNETAWILKRTITITVPNVVTDHRNPQASRSIDLNKDGIPEILFQGGKTSTGTDGVYALSIPINPLTSEWNLTRLTLVGGDGFGVGDIDGDGNLDITIGKPRDDVNGGISDIYWYKNSGFPGLWNGYTVGTTEKYADRFEIADVDGDNRPDILVSEETYPNFNDPGSAYWFKNPVTPETSTWAQNMIGTYHGYYAPQSMDVADMDEDGDFDVIIGEHQNQKRIFVLENNGMGNFTEHLVGSGKESHGLVVSDIDNDGDFDIIHIGWNDYQSLHLWENEAKKVPLELPVINIQPMNQEVVVGNTATFRVDATGKAPLSYQWQKNGIDIQDATSALYETPATTMSDNGSIYRVNVTNVAGSVISNNAILSVTASSQVSHTISLSRGWNMVSLPVNISNASIGAIFGSNVTTVYGWTGTSYELSSELEPKRGYWALSSSNYNITVTGTPVVDRDITLKRGWNMVGPVTDGIMVSSLQNVTTVYGWTGTSYVILSSSDTLTLTRGYWMLANATSIIQI